MAEEQQSFQNKLDLEAYKKKIGHSSYSDKGSGTGSITASDNYIQKKNEAETYGNSLDEMKRVEMKNMFGGEIPKASEVETWKNSTDDTKKSKYKQYQKAAAAAEAKYLKLQRDANEAAVKFGKIPKYRNILTVTDIETFGKEYDFDYVTAWRQNSVNYLGEYYPKMTTTDFDAAVNSADKTKPLYPQIENYMKNKFKK
jgi:hypothetical protein